jgi:uncharacterized protein YjbI with pentapeptide repeats
VYRLMKGVLWLGGILVAILVVLLLIRISYGHSWTGFGQDKVKEHVEPAKTLWDWLDLLIIPVVIAIGGFLFNSSQNRATQAAAERRSLDDTLQAYLDGMAQLITDKEQPLHSAKPGDSLSTLARARTLTVLRRLDSGRKRRVLEFLYESRLIDKEQALLNESELIERQHNIISLRQANLRGTNLYMVYLRKADLREADLKWADMYGARLYGADLREADLRWADLSVAHLIGADLRQANLQEADLRWAHLDDADLQWADLRKADLRNAFLVGVRTWSEEQLRRAKSLKGATMPDGQPLKSANNPDGPTFEEWLKSQGRKEDGENE